MKKEQKIATGIGIAGVVAAAIVHALKEKEGPVPPAYTCPYCVESFPTYEELLEHIQQDHQQQPPPPPTEYGMVSGYISDSETEERIPNANIYVDGLLSAMSDSSGMYSTDYLSFGPHSIKVEANNYQDKTIEFAIEQENVRLDIFLDKIPYVPSPPSDWTEGVTVREVKVEPSTLYIGGLVAIVIYLDYPTPVPVTIHATISVDSTELSGDFDATYARIRFDYTPPNTGKFTVTAQDKTAHFTVLQDIASTYYMPWGGVRMPVCAEWANGECVAWNPANATVSDYVFHVERWQVFVLAVDYTCKEYWDTKDELASVIAKGLGYGRWPILNEWVLNYGKTCPVCNGTGQVVCTHDMHACMPGRLIECRNCHGTGKVLLVDLERGWRDWQKEIAYHSVCGAGQCTPSVRCPYCDRKIYGPSHTRGLSWDKESFVRQVLNHIETKHPSHPLTEPARF